MNLLDGGEPILFSGKLSFAFPIATDYMTSYSHYPGLTFYSHYPWRTCSPDTCPSASLRCPGGCSRQPCAEDLFHSRPANCERFLCCEVRGCSIEVKEVNSKINQAANHSKVSKTVEIIRIGHIIKTLIKFSFLFYEMSLIFAKKSTFIWQL